MSRFLNRYVRKIHRWLALPFVVLIITAVLARNTPAAFIAQRGQQVVLLSMAITGLYLLFLPWWTKRRRRKRDTTVQVILETDA